METSGSHGQPFDAVVLIAFGGPQGNADIRPFLANVVRPARASGRREPVEGRGRPIPLARIDEVAHHYELFGGVSPLTELTMKQADGLRQRLAAAAVPLPVYVGMRNWHPLLPDVLADMSRAGIRRALGFIMAAHGCYSSCQQYKENVRDARAAIRGAGLADVDVVYAHGWHAHHRFVEANAEHVRHAIGRLPVDLAHRARLIFTAHSIPTRLAEASNYGRQLLESAEAVAARAGCADWALVFQSRSGRPEDPWLGPDICDYLSTARAEGLESAVLCPIGFLCDHIEVLYDLDHEAANVARDIGLVITRAAAVNDNPLFLDMMAEVVLAAIYRYGSGRPLSFAL